MEKKIETGLNLSEEGGDDEPPGKAALLKNITTDEPPGPANWRNHYYGHIPDELWNDWKWQFRNRITTVEELEKFLPLSGQETSQLKLVTSRFPMAITPHYLSLIDPDDPNDPVRKQAVPSFDEILYADIGEADPLEEERDSPVTGLVHRYPDRVLMVLTDLCPMLCRHCTRKREWHNGGWVRNAEQIKEMLRYISEHEEIRDVVLSGGDLLTLSTSHLESVISQLRKIKHVEIIRIGSRYPVVLPQRIDAELCAMLSKYGPIWLNTHFNHSREVTPDSAAACDRMLRAGVPVNNQSVLLRGINDTVEAQMKLVHSLLKAKVRPYYLFQCDEVQGTEHLRTPVETGLKIIEGLRGHTSGLAVPTFVIDLPGGGGKIPVQPDYVLKKTDKELVLRNYEKKTFRFRNPGIRRNGNGKGIGRPLRVDPAQVPLNMEISGKGAASEDRVIV